MKSLKKHTESKILISWLAINNDPFERDRNTRQYISSIPGPTLTLLFDDTSEYRNKINKVIFLV